MSMLKTVERGTPSPAEQTAAQAATRVLARFGRHERIQVEVRDKHDNTSETLILPATAVRLLTDVLGYLAEGRSVAVMPEEALLTTQQAASMLNVSRPHLIKLLDGGKIEFQRIGTHRRVLLRNLRSYHQEQAAAAARALDDLVKQAQELDMGYSPNEGE